MSNDLTGIPYSPLLDEMYLQWLQDPASVDPDWQRYFGAAANGSPGTAGIAPSSNAYSQGIVQAGPLGAGAANGAGSSVSSSAALSGGSSALSGPDDRHSVYHSVSLRTSAYDESVAGASVSVDDLKKQGRVNSLIWAYRDIGYIYANLNPLEGYMTPDQYYQLYSIEGEYESIDPTDFGLEEADLERVFHTGAFIQPPMMKLRDLIAKLHATYCGSIGVEIMHIQNKAIRKWLFNHLEGPKAHRDWTGDEKIQFQKHLIKAEEFEIFLQKSFIGQKRFSLEGAETLIPALQRLIASAADNGLHEMVFGMAHRGRLNVLCNALGKEPVEIFSAFVDNYTPHTYGGSGDVKYHQGHSYDYYDEDTGRTIHLSLVANPSHLEAVDPVVEGKTRGIQRRRGDRLRKKVVPILIHGDAAFSGQGVVAETLNLSQLKGYRTGGTIHIIVNNQIGFTTASRDSRSTFFATDIAKSISIPIIHVNGDDPEAVCKVIDIAIRYRQKFATDIVIDMICYRRLGHNEADEPSFTHPKMYSIINSLDSVRVLYGRKLAAEGTWTSKDQDAFSEEYRAYLNGEVDKAKTAHVPALDDAYQGATWSKFSRTYNFDTIETGVDMSTLAPIAETLTRVPDTFKIHPKLARFVEDRRVQFFDEKAVDWAFAESLAFGSLLVLGYPVRLSGEDCQRGTFSQRHAVWWDTSAAVPTSYIPLRHISDSQGFFAVYDSPLSEFSVLGFEYGYSLALPDALIMWEAQFGDFVNGAQVIIDQFIVAGETKWFRSSGLVMLLPHGYEGQGPEHSYAHLERFLSLCAESNIQVIYPTTPAQYFHALRRQVLQPFRKPMVVMTPKSLLRNKVARSPISEFVKGSFVNVIDDDTTVDASVERVLLCSGKVYYDLIAEREKRGDKSTAIIRLEQIYPFPNEELKTICARYTKAKVFRWVQEESRNRGAWYFVFQRFPDFVPRGKRLEYCGRASGASPATGSHKQHTEELAAFLEAAFSPAGKGDKE